MTSHGNSDFWRLYRNLPLGARKAARKAYQQFAADPSQPGLRFHRLNGSTRLWSVRISSNYRAVGAVEGNSILWIWIGSHADFDKRFPK